MNCKQVEQLLPLYVSRDLDPEREHLIAAHVQVCANCHGAADEYRETRELLQNFTAPAFNQGIYDQIRSGVWREIEGEAAAPSMSEVIAGWFTPRLAWGAATAVLIVVAVFAIYFIAGRNTARNVAGSSPEVKRNLPNGDNGAQPPRDTSTAAPSASRDGIKGQRPAYIRVTERRGRRKLDRTNTLVANAGESLPSRATSPTINNAAKPDSSSAGDSGKILRMELQTSNPNIRIIWLSHPEPKRSPNSKGI